MSFTPRLYINNIDIKNIMLSKEQVHYLCNVLRLKASDLVKIFNPNGQWLCEIIEIDKRKCSLKMIEQTHKARPKTKGSINLAFAPTKGLGASFIVQKACELGANYITPIITKRSIVKSINHDKLNKVAIEAAEQCERLDLPQISPMITLPKLIENCDGSKILFCYERCNNQIIYELTHDDNITIVIGPEGGFSDDEVKTLQNLPNSHTLSLGPNILKAETACVSALAIIINKLYAN